MLLPTGEELGTLPLGSTVAYQLTADQLNCTFTITGTLPTLIVHFDNASGMISWQ